MIIIFGISVFLILYSYLIFPFILILLSINRKPNSVIYNNDDELPLVSIIISAFNEEKVIEEKIKTTFNTTYPQEKIQVIIGSDASTDDTNKIVKGITQVSKQVIFLEFPKRRGKSIVVNELVEHASGEVLILTDANVFFEKETIFEMIKHFKNQEIGLVDTNMKKCNLKKEGISLQEKTYINIEVSIKNKESLIWGTMMGPFGGCFALRKNLFCPVPENNLVDDFYINMKILEKGKKAINEMASIVHEDVSNDLNEEIRRKKRIAAGNFQNLIHFKYLIFSHIAGLSFCFISHKIIRWFVPFLLIFAFISNSFLVSVNTFFKITFVLQFLLIIIPLFDFLLKKTKIHIAAFRFITHFYFMNLALMLGFFKYAGGIKSGIWQPTRRNQ
ncbi:MAG: glycosyltransferase [Bacteroidales bacterium]|jgi:cellulose synthase/poly-beta-1,6-N-acetylglucosamine synthase-like glycosyltransferase